MPTIQYSARSARLSVHKLFTSCIRQCLVSRACNWVMSALSAVLLIYSLQFRPAFLSHRSARRRYQEATRNSMFLYVCQVPIPSLHRRSESGMEDSGVDRFEWYTVISHKILLIARCRQHSDCLPCEKTASFLLPVRNLILLQFFWRHQFPIIKSKL